MAMRKVADLVVKTGEWTDSTGQKKARWLNVGRVMQGDDGSEFMLLNRTFNPAGVPDDRGGDAILIRRFDARQDGDQARPAAGARPSGPAQPPPDFDDDIPF